MIRTSLIKLEGSLKWKGTSLIKKERGLERKELASSNRTARDDFDKPHQTGKKPEMIGNMPNQDGKKPYRTGPPELIRQALSNQKEAKNDKELGKSGQK